MSHGIEKQDRVFSTTSTEWHGLATVVESIGKPEIDILHFPVLETDFGFTVDGITIPMKDWKVIAADLRHRLDLPENERIVPLHIPKQGYTPISNRDLFQQAQDICKGLDMKIVTMGTLEGCKKFFMSIDTGSANLTVKNRANGKEESILAFIDLINSHDGTMAQETYDSMTRIVCMNTLGWSRLAKGSLGGKVFHTKNAKLSMDAMAKRVNEILSGRVIFVETMERLSQITLEKADAFPLALAYVGQSNAEESGKANRVSTRGINAAESISDLFNNGKGNVGKSRYDLFNGATEYWTSGDGTGKKLDTANKQFKAKFGAAADHKTAFLRFIDDTDDNVSNRIETGKALHAEYLANKN